MSTHAVNVIRIPVVEKHPMVDTLGMVKIGGYTCVVKLGAFNEGDLAVYVEPDYVVPEGRPEFAFLVEHRRIKARKFRGVYSHGLLIAVELDMHEGQDVMERLGIVRYEPVLEGDADEAPHPSLSGLAAYDVENWESNSLFLVHETSAPPWSITGMGDLLYTTSQPLRAWDATWLRLGTNPAATQRREGHRCSERHPVDLRARTGLGLTLMEDRRNERCSFDLPHPVICS